MRRRSLALALAVLLPPLAHATRTEEIAVHCPVCGNEFRAERWMSTNSGGGVDRDFLEHAAGGQVFILACWTCPRCCYTGFDDDFDAEKAPKELVAKLKKENPLVPAEPIDPKTGHTGRIPGWVRYDLLIQVLKLAPDATDSHLAGTCLRAAQTQRFDWKLVGEFEKRHAARFKKAWDALPEATRVGNPYDAYMAIARGFEAEAADPKAGAEALRDALVAAALAYKARGEDGEAQRVLAPLEKDAELGAEHKAIVAEIRARIERERKYQALAIPYFERHLAGGKPGAEEATATQYLLGVLYRRTGDSRKAVATLEPLLANHTVPDAFKEWIKDEIAKAKAG